MVRASLLVAPTYCGATRCGTGDGSHGETRSYVAQDTVTKKTKPKSTMATTPTLPKTGDSCWIAASLTLFLLGTVLLNAAFRC